MVQAGTGGSKFGVRIDPIKEFADVFAQAVTLFTPEAKQKFLDDLHGDACVTKAWIRSRLEEITIMLCFRSKEAVRVSDVDRVVEEIILHLRCKRFPSAPAAPKKNWFAQLLHRWAGSK